MRRTYLTSFLLAGAIAAVAIPVSYLSHLRKEPGWNADRSQYTLFNGWKLSPVGRAVTLPGDMPTSILFVDGGKRALINTSGYHDHSLNLVDLEQGEIVASAGVDHAWIGLTQAKSGEILLSGAEGDDSIKYPAVHRFSLVRGELKRTGGFDLPQIAKKDQFVSTLLRGPQGLYVLNAQTDQVLLLSDAGGVIAETKVGYRPYGAALSPDNRILAVSNWGDRSVSLLDPRSLSLIRKVAVDSHPTSLVFGSDGRLFVSNAGSNTVCVITQGAVTERIVTTPADTQRIGATPVALALSPDSRTLYVANAGMNCVAVIDVSNPSKARVRGFIPTERYPTAIAVTPDGKRLLVGTAKGFYGPNAGPGVELSGAQIRGKQYGVPYRYIAQQLTGRLTIIDVPNSAALHRMTALVQANLPKGSEAVPAPKRREIEARAFRKIKHVIYVIRENRTYDQVLGDIRNGNGDPRLTLFGERITPNSHRLVNTFALFDNLYADGEVSQSGHQWTSAAYANDYCEKQWLLSYSDRGEIDSDPRLTSSPGDYIWSLARKHGKTARVYGEYVDVQEDHDALTNAEVRADPEKFGYSAGYEAIFARGGRDTEKVELFKKELDVAERTGKWPNLMVIALPEDHTHGFSAGQYTPNAMVANNDWAIGQLVEAVSHSRFWPETAIFIIQDDAQDGPDHVDAHRTVGLVISPYIRRGAVDSTHYTTASMLRTMELILGLPPMTEFDARATPMYNAFTTKPDLEPYHALAPWVSVDERNPARTALARRSAKLDFSELDRANSDALNRLLWDGYRPGVPYPTPVHRANVTAR